MERSELEIKKLEIELSKLLLEKQKLEKELETFPEKSPNEEKRLTENQKIERNKIWVTPIITLIITIGATWITHIIKGKESRSENINEATKTLLAYSAQFDTIDFDIHKKYFFIKNIALYPNYDNESIKLLQDTFIRLYRNGSILDSFRKSVNKAVSLQDSSSINISSRNKLNISDAAAIQLQNAKTNNLRPDSIKKIEQVVDQNKILATQHLSNNLSRAISAIDSINERTVTQIQSLSTNSRNDMINDYGISWFKVGYYLQFDDMRILLQGLDKQSGIQIQICQTKGEQNCNEENSIITNQLITYNSPLTITVGGATYQISLRTIDNAGANPFKLAAYINVAKLNNTPVLNLASTFVKLYYISATASKALEINELFKPFNLKFQSSDKPEGYSINEVKYNQIVFYNNDQIKYCQAIQKILQNNNMGLFTLRPSSGFGEQTDHFKIYLIK